MNNKTEIQYVLITGASCGLGKELAKECARRGMNLLLTALPNEEINILGNYFSQNYGVQVRTFEADLTKPEELKKLAVYISEKYEVKILINNAGLGGVKTFLEAETEYVEQIVLLNMHALVLLTRLMLPNLKRQENAYILNIASMASFSPMPFKTVYPASKAFVYSFSRGLDAELKGTGVSVSVAHPGGMKTNAEVTHSIENYNRLIRTTTLSVEKVAQICIKSLLKRKRIIIPGFLNKISWVLLKITPLWMRLEMMRSSIRKDIELKNNYQKLQGSSPK
ncbi:MAG: SDR family NAD(P)-dependent oxidoreductase [Bacteroidota bacterium]